MKKVFVITVLIAGGLVAGSGSALAFTLITSAAHYTTTWQNSTGQACTATTTLQDAAGKMLQQQHGTGKMDSYGVVGCSVVSLSAQCGGTNIPATNYSCKSGTATIAPAFAIQFQPTN